MKLCIEVIWMNQILGVFDVKTFVGRFFQKLSFLISKEKKKFEN